VKYANKKISFVRDVVTSNVRNVIRSRAWDVFGTARVVTYISVWNTLFKIARNVGLIFVDYVQICVLIVEEQCVKAAWLNVKIVVKVFVEAVVSIMEKKIWKNVENV
jgi:hypothetical protein